jgi:hydroxyacylglutathione hydrolase
MLLKYFYDKSLAHASYMVGCQRSGEALVIDPSRNVEPYLEAAAAEGLRIVGSAETHIHADFVSGSRELADRVGAKLYLSDEGPADWKYGFADQHASQLLKHNDIIRIGMVKLEVLHTPGHTPEHISFLLTDEGGGANVPMGIFTGDFVFVGSIGRPDLLETAAGVAGSAESGARQLYHSMRKFRELPDHLQVWPAHGAGSACGKGLGAVPSSTVGYEKLFNPALQFQDEQQFVEYILTEQPETPFYFAEMKRVNKVGPDLLRTLAPVKSPAVDLLPAITRKGLTIDVSPAAEFAAAHVPGTINVPLNMLVQWAGFFVDYSQPLHLIAEPSALPEILRKLRSIGIDKVCGSFDASAVKSAGLRTESYRSLAPQELRSSIERGELKLLDVRAETEFRSGHIAGAEHRFLGKLLRDVKDIDRSRPVVAQCLAGGRSAIATSILQRAGLDVTNMSGGYNAWVAAGLPVNKDTSTKH